MKRERLIVIGPLPPPYHGVTVSTSLVLANRTLRDRFDMAHLDTSDHRTTRNIGRWDVTNVGLAVRAALGLVRLLHGRSGVVYMPLSQSTPGVLRDSIFVLLSSARGWKVAAHLRGGEFRGYYDDAHPVLRWWVRAMLARVDSVAVMGDSLRDMFSGLLPATRLAVVPNGTPPFEPNPPVRTDPEHVLFLTNLRVRKGVLEAVEAALIVCARRPSSRFTFAGDWESDELEERVRRRAASADGHIEFRAPVSGPEKDRLLGSAAVILFPTVEPEGHPRIVLEALAAGVPVVATDRGAIRDTVVDGVSGFVLDEPDPQLLARRILRLLDDEALRAQFGRAAHRRYLERFTQADADEALDRWLRSVR